MFISFEVPKSAVIDSKTSNMEEVIRQHAAKLPILEQMEIERIEKINHQLANDIYLVTVVAYQKAKI